MRPASTLFDRYERGSSRRAPRKSFCHNALHARNPATVIAGLVLTANRCLVVGEPVPGSDAAAFYCLKMSTAMKVAGPVPLFSTR
jgi:hypothetical protein